MIDTMNQRDHRKVRTVFMLGPDEREGLEKVSADTGAPVSELLRRSVVLWLNQQRESGLKPQGQSV